MNIDSSSPFRWIVNLMISFLLPMACTSDSTSPSPTNTNGSSSNGPTVSVWITNPDRSALFTKVSNLTFTTGAGLANSIVVDSTVQYQEMDGFGYTLTGGSAQLIRQKLSQFDRSNLLNELFLSDQNHIGISYLRISIGASDLDDHVFSYDDLPVDQTDVSLDNFSLDPDRQNLIPLLKEILLVSPNIKIIGSPWSAPAWMKTDSAVKGGNLKAEYYPVYANYFVKYIQQMATEGIPIDAITIQNEPENPGNTPSMLMTSSQQSDFIQLYLGPAFEAAGIKTKIILFDHNCDHPDYPISILNDPETKKYVDGSAFHMYSGDVSAMSTVHAAYPDKNIYFTEQWTSGNGNFGGDLRWHVKNLIIGAPRNWSRTVLEWNLAADEKFEPHTDDGGCTLCQGALTINSNTGAISRNVSYYIIAHASKLVRPGSVRISSSIIDNLFNVAFLTPDGKKVVIVVNDNNTEKSFSIKFKKYSATAALPAGGVGTYSW